MVASIVDDELFGLENFAVPHEIPERITYALETLVLLTFALEIAFFW